VVLISVA